MHSVPALLLVCSAVILAISFGVRQSFGLFLEPMTLEFGWSVGVFAFAVALQNLLWGLSQPLFGALADRYGVVKTVVIGGALYLLGLLIMAFGGTPASLYLGTGLLVGFGVSGTSFSLILAAVARSTVPERRSLALGIVSAGGSLGQVVMPLVAQGMIGGYGWLAAMLVFCVFAGMMMPLAFGVARADRLTHGAAQVSLGAAVREASGHRGYWLLNAGFFVCGFHVAFIATHLPGYLATLDFSPNLAAWALATIGLFNVVGSFGAGILGATHRKKYLLSWIYLLRSVVFVAFLVAPMNELTVLLLAACIGLLWLSTVPLTGALVGQIFGPRYMATLFGVVMMSHQLGGFFGAWVGGYVFDVTGSYDAAWMFAVGLGLASAALHLPIADRPLRAECAPA